MFKKGKREKIYDVRCQNEEFIVELIGSPNKKKEWKKRLYEDHDNYDKTYALYSTFGYMFVFLKKC